MDTPIGRRFRESSVARVVVGIGALLVVSLDMFQSAQSYSRGNRTMLAAVILVLFLAASGGDRSSIGLRATPIQPFRYWAKITIIIGFIMLIPILAFSALVISLKLEMPIHRIPPDRAAAAFVRMCLVAPILEEMIYRFALCTAASAVFRPTGVIVLSGCAFAALHFLYGNPGPDNFVAGYFLAWVYLKSGSLVIPIALHALGNSFAWSAQLCAWYLA